MLMNNTIIPYIITDGKNGVLVPVNDERSMAEKVIFLLENQDIAQKIALNAFNDCKTNYSWEVNGQKWLDLYGVK